MNMINPCEACKRYNEELEEGFKKLRNGKYGQFYDLISKLSWLYEKGEEWRDPIGPICKTCKTRLNGVSIYLPEDVEAWKGVMADIILIGEKNKEFLSMIYELWESLKPGQKEEIVVPDPMTTYLVNESGKLIEKLGEYIKEIK